MRLLAIDGNSILNRAFYGIRLLSNQKGIYTNAIFGFMNIYFKHVSEVKPDRIAVAFDLKAPTFRHKAVDSYKANRKGMPEELAMQMPYIKQLLTDMGISIVTCEGYEADDILGTLAAQCAAAGDDCFIVTGDRDSLQLVDTHVTVRLVTNKETIPYTPQRFQEEYGFPAIRMIDLKALMGDTSDNISGVAGIGPKTASGLIQTWDTVENLYEHLETADLTKGVRNKLTVGKDAAFQSKWLATIVTDAPIGSDLSAYDIQPMNAPALKKLLLELELVKLMEKLNLDGISAEDAAETETACDTQETPAVTLSETTLTAENLTDCIRNSGEPVPYLFDGTRLDILSGETVFSTEDTDVICAFLGHEYPKLTFSAKPHDRFLLEHGGMLPQIRTEDCELAAYLLNPTTSEYRIEHLCVSYHVSGNTTNFTELSALPVLFHAMKQQLEQQDMTDLYTMEKKLTGVLAHMEHEGVRIDTEGVRQFGTYLTEQIEEIQQKIYEEAGHEFNIGSPKQLGKVLFEEMQLPHGKKTKTGYSTNADVLEELRKEYPIVESILCWRQYSKLRSTYVDGLLKTVAPDGRIHSVFKQTETRTGRISSTEPNLQNIPIRTELGRNMRKFFIAAEDCVLLDADYSQIELRILASLCGDEQMQEAFLSGADIHTATAAQVFGMPPEMVTSEMRSAAKAVNFGIIYGIGAFSLSKDIGVTVYQADRYIKNYLARYPKVEAFMDKIVADAKANGYVSTYFHRRRPVPELRQSNKMVQAAGKRIAMNTPIQGTAADIIKMAMVQVQERLAAEVPEAKLILQVHDELIVEVPQRLALKAAKILGEEMQNVVNFPVPLTAEVNIGGSWYDAKG